ncbi:MULTISPECIES: hypothetical protein [Pseudomonas]|uniref:hypothetical protein n=1 Tax=Pseudomonas TaxID=286 RepID=UPI001304DB98|nr:MULTISPECIES: hypothetical protein [Pseudomonas]QXN50999.1 hypothetical protein KW062_04260 [Pseudomonas fluorescens]WSO25316.1 hypothetical protein VUJ50_04275 [Pseudomonas fluorescens]
MNLLEAHRRNGKKRPVEKDGHQGTRRKLRGVQGAQFSRQQLSAFEIGLRVLILLIAWMNGSQLERLLSDRFC